MEIKSDIKTAPFYPGLISEEQQDTVRKSDLWPILLSLHFNTGGKIFITEVEDTRINLRTSQGTHVLGVKKLREDISVHLSADIIWPVLYKQDLVSSNNPKYIVNKLKQDGDVIQRIKTHAEKLDKNLIPETIQKLVRGFAGQIKESGTEISFNMSEALQQYSLRALFEGDKLKLQPDQVNGLKTLYTKLQDSDNKKARYAQKYLEMFGPIKHLLIHMRPSGLNIVGTVKEIESDYKVKVVVSQDLRMIKNISDDPQLMASLAFWKILRESRKNHSYPTLGTDGMLINNTNLVDLEAGSMVNGEAQDNRAYGIYLIHKTGEVG